MEFDPVALIFDADENSIPGRWLVRYSSMRRIYGTFESREAAAREIIAQHLVVRV